jgi:hypothetical protein
LAVREDANMGRWRIWLGSAGVVALAGGLFLLSPRLGGFGLILLALAAVAIVAYRLL